MPVGALIGGGGALRRLLRLLFRLAVIHLILHEAREFLVRYTHIPWLGSLVIVIAVIVLVQLIVSRRRRR